MQEPILMKLIIKEGKMVKTLWTNWWDEIRVILKKKNGIICSLEITRNWKINHFKITKLNW